MAQATGVRFERLPPPDGFKDWNDFITQGRTP